MASLSEQSDPMDFQPTQWTLVAKAGDRGDPLHEESLSRLLDLYRPALCCHLVRRRRIDPEQADDLLQEFIVRKVLEYNLPARADRTRGKFRNLLLTALDNFIRTQRGSQERLDPLSENMEHCDDAAGPEEAFDVQWARQVLQEALRRMQAECRQSGRLDVWEVFESRIVAPALEGVAPVEYEALVSRLKLRSPMQASNLLMTAKRMFERTLRAVIGEYCGEDEVEREIAELRQILGSV